MLFRRPGKPFIRLPNGCIFIAAARTSLRLGIGPSRTYGPPWVSRNFKFYSVTIRIFSYRPVVVRTSHGSRLRESTPMDGGCKMLVQGRCPVRIVSIVNQKGGCGKTTTSINLAACLARLGQRTLLVDMDPQGHCGIGLAVPESQIQKTIFDAMIEPTDGKPARMSEIIWQIATDFDLAPSNLRLAAFEQHFAGRPGRESRLQQALDQVKDKYDWCILDCPPSVGLLVFNALYAAHEVIVPVETGFFSLHGLSKMMETLEHLGGKLGRKLGVRVLPTLYDTRTKLAREVLSELRSRFGDYLMESAVNFNTKLKEAASFGQPITEYDPGSRGYKDFVNLARELMGHRDQATVPTPAGESTRPAELVQRARQLASLTNVQFGRTTVSVPAAATLPTDETVVVNGSYHGGTSIITDISESASALTLTADGLAGMVATDPISRLGLTLTQVPIELEELPTKTAAEITQEKIDRIYGIRQTDDGVTFAVKLDSAGSVRLAGDFNDWSDQATPMLRYGDSEFTTTISLKPGRYRYRLVVDGQWINDPHNEYVEQNEFGATNNIVEVA